MYNGDEDCRLIKELESSENPLIIPLLMNCRTDNVELVSKSVPCGIQQSASLLVDIDALEEREDIYSDDNGVWTQKVCKTKYFNTITSANNKVVGLTKVSREEEADITVRRRTYTKPSINSWFQLSMEGKSNSGTRLSFCSTSMMAKKNPLRSCVMETENKHLENRMYAPK